MKFIQTLGFLFIIFFSALQSNGQPQKQFPTSKPISRNKYISQDRQNNISCNNWLNTIGLGAGVKVGDLDVSGNKITVEALINRTSPYFGGNLYAGNIVSKHDQSSNTNYLLRPNSAEITTSNGYFITMAPCEITLNKTYHVAFVYDGASLKFYRNGYLMSQVAATGTLLVNNFITTIGEKAVSYPTAPENFYGFINEVRIWNVAKTQAELRADMNGVLSSPTTQPGLLGYYTFDNLLNKQGNALFNGTQTGAASINTSNPNCNFIVDSCEIIKTTTPLSCTNWLSLPAHPSYASVGNLNVTGNKITVEAVINRTSFYSNNVLTDGDVVSKHNTPADINYLLRPTNALITTSTGFYQTPNVCPLVLNKTYHIAMVYDGSTLKYYRNGFLMSQVAATGNLVQNNWRTLIGYYDPQFWSESFVGYINEVRIWNVARTATEINAFKDISLPSPSSQLGLLAYYTFDNLLNKQGNTAWNATLVNNASINATVANCGLVADSCEVRTANTISNIINDYTPVISFLPCDNKVQVEDGSAFHTGDTVLIIQMKGAVIDSTNTANFGTVTDYKNAGNYEFNYIKSVVGNIIELKNVVIRQYDLPDGKVQLIRVPYFYSTTVSSTLTCLPWDGKKGGVLVFNVRDTLTLSANMDVSGKGFRGGTGINSLLNNWQPSCQSNGFFYPSASAAAQDKGEGIANFLSQSKMSGRGALANGGGGGNLVNSGGGGGSNASAGGIGGNQFSGCTVNTGSNAGLPGKQLAYSNTNNRIFLGGGGGAGDANDPLGSAAFNPSGGNGGGIIIISADKLFSNSYGIISNGDEGKKCTTNCNEGMGGGGAGGSVLLSINTFSAATNLTAKGGNGGNNTALFLNGLLNHGPGGGGSGGIAIFKQATTPAGTTFTSTGGLNGVVVNNSNINWGAQPGNAGVSQFNYNLVISVTPFKKNIDSVRIKDTLNSCSIYHFGGLAYITSAPIVSWQWNFGDNQTANTQNTIHPYGTAGIYQVKLIVTDANGCKDSIIKAVTVIPSSNFDFSFKIDICIPLQVQFFDAGTNSQNPYWSFGDGTFVTGSTSPIHTFSGYGNYNIKYTISNSGCVDTVRKNVTLQNPWSNVVLTNDTTICFGASKQLVADSSSEFCWSPITYLNNPNISNPITSTPQSITYHYTKKELGTNLVTNPNFSAGNTGFTSAYNYVTTASNAGQYFVGPSAPAWYSSFSNCTADHTNGTGNMMIVRQSSTSGVSVWAQTLNVQPNTNYEVSCWIENIGLLAPSKLQFLINGLPIGDTLRATTQTCSWKQFFYTWNSGNTTSANFSILSLNSESNGNGFALDDISFAPLNIYHDSVKITVDTPRVVASIDTSICQNSAVQIFASGATSYQWTPATGLSSATAFDPIASPTATTQYIVTGTTAAGCRAKDTVNVTVRPGTSFDFSYKQDVCNPLIVQFTDLNTGSLGSYWNFGDGTSISGPTNPIHTYNSEGNYLVKYYISNAGCIDTVRKTITVGVVPDDIIITHDTTICIGNTKQLLTKPSLSFCWTPTTYLNNPNIANPTTSTPQNITYYFTAETVGTNIITNGDFSLGNTGFTSQYNFANPNTTEGQYYVGTNPSAWNASLSSCGDHTTGAGNMMLVNGASASDVNVWKQTITVTPNTNYAFSTWVQALWPPNPAQLRFSINGRDVGNMIIASLPTCTWTQFHTTWNSGSNTSATIAIVNKNTAIQGNDFALDDISFAPVTIKRDSVKISIETPFIKTSADTSICSGTSLQINTTGSLSYSWLPPTGLSSAGIANPIANPLVPTQYIVTGTSANNCIAKDTLNVSILQKPTISKLPDTTICLNSSIQLSASGGIGYQWTPAASLNNAALPNPTANPLITTTYTVIITGTNTCSNKDSIIVSVSPPKAFSIDRVRPICLNDTIQLAAHGGDIYLWSPATDLSGTSISNPFAFPNQTTTYTVAITDQLCNRTQTLTVDLSVRALPIVTANSANPIDCNTGSSRLNATGALIYTWLPISDLSNPNLSSPVASPDTNTIYQVKGTDAFGCSNTDTTLVLVKYNANAKYYLPNAFTPNNDGLNDCFGVRNWGNVTNLQFTIFNRWGEKVFQTTNPSECWDGRYKQELQQSGNFIYIIKAKTACGRVDTHGSVLLVR